jgi:patatin-like phospholipase/acyl hydrolase
MEARAHIIITEGYVEFVRAAIAATSPEETEKHRQLEQLSLANTLRLQAKANLDRHFCHFRYSKKATRRQVIEESRSLADRYRHARDHFKYLRRKLKMRQSSGDPGIA